jgi:hypothetical protein
MDTDRRTELHEDTHKQRENKTEQLSNNELGG